MSLFIPKQTVSHSVFYTPHVFGDLSRFFLCSFQKYNFEERLNVGVCLCVLASPFSFKQFDTSVRLNLIVIYLVGFNATRTEDQFYLPCSFLSLFIWRCRRRREICTAFKTASRRQRGVASWHPRSIVRFVVFFSVRLRPHQT